MKKFYTDERNIQIVIALLKANGIKKVIASPGATNVTFVGSLQQDPWFEMYSSVDERSAAYIACGLAEESGEPVVLSCTGATASRNYMPGLTEAFYRKLPIIAITSTQSPSRIGNHIAQVIDRTIVPNDICKFSALIPLVKDSEDEWDCEIKVNQALIALRRDGGGPVHLNLVTSYSKDFDIKELPQTRNIKRITIYNQNFPQLPSGKIGIFVGSHHKWTNEETETINKFCAQHNAVIFCDQTSNYKGKYRILAALVGAQDNYISEIYKLNLLIHIGEVSGGYDSLNILKHCKTVWRVNEDGKIRDTIRKASYVFDMPEIEFFKRYINNIDNKENNSYYLQCLAEYNSLLDKIPELPFSNIWIAKQLASNIPQNSVVHLGILNTLRSWNFFEIPSNVYSYSNVGGFGIDGGLSSLLGASLYDKNKLYFGFMGDLSFFYDMNALGNRHLGNNIRLMMINNGKGTEFRNYNHPANRFGDEADSFMAASGHYGNKSTELIKQYSQNLGFEYICAKNKEEFNNVMNHFISPNTTNRPIFFEVFTDSQEESNALYILRNLKNSPKLIIRNTIAQTVRNTLGDKVVQSVKKIMR